MQILIVDNTIDPDSWGASDLGRLARKSPGVTIHVRRAPQEDLPRDLALFDRIIVSGSKTSVLEEAPWIEKLDDLIQRCLDQGKPLLGICYGHQALVRVLGGKQLLRRTDTGEFGWARIKLTASPEASPLTRGLPREFHSFAWHYDEVVSLPRGMRNLATSRDCAIQACQLEDRPVYGLQFHPERAPEDGQSSLDRLKKEKPKFQLLHPAGGARLFDPRIGETLFSNFLGIANA